MIKFIIFIGLVIFVSAISSLFTITLLNYIIEPKIIIKEIDTSIVEQRIDGLESRMMISLSHEYGQIVEMPIEILAETNSDQILDIYNKLRFRQIPAEGDE